MTTMPLPRAYTSVLAVPRSIARSLEKMLNSDLRLCRRVEEWNPLDDIRDLALSNRCHYRAYPVASVRMGGRVHNSMGRTPFCRQTKVPVPQEFVPEAVPAHWITIFFCTVFTPPLAFCAVIVTRLSPGGSGGIK